MTEFKGTPGKWYHDNGNSLSVFHPEAIGVRLATVEKTSTIGKHDYDLSIKPTDEYKYNALLISKAPEMLEMLILIIDHFEDLTEEYGVESNEKMNAIKNAKQLIKDATELS